tara:strand:- start:372 stop:788 length:417 start_codon:yes stop_codon:yes gene_type:complete
MSNNFGVGTKEVYQRTSFISQLIDGQSYWDARMVLFDFFYAYQCGYVKNYFPTPGFSMDEVKVRKCIQKLDFEWNKEAISRAGKIYTGGAPKFEDILKPPQQLALIEALSKIMPEWVNNIEKKEKEEAQREAQKNYYD